MTRLIIAALVVVSIVGTTSTSFAKAKNGDARIEGDLSCGEYLDAHSRTNLNSGGFNGPHKAWGAYYWISGFMTAYNAVANNGKESVLGSMGINDARSWVASWCRENPSKTLYDGTKALIIKLDY